MSEYATYESISPRQLEQLHKSDKALFEYLDEGVGSVPTLCLQKDWDALYYLLDPHRRTPGYWHRRPDSLLGRAVLGGGILNEPYVRANGEDFPPRYLTTEEVFAIAAALGRVTEEDLVAAFDPDQMGAPTDPNMSVYSSERWYHRASAEETFERFRARFDELREFYSAAAAVGNAVLVSIG